MRKPLHPGTLALVAAVSGNRKIGDAATTYAAQASCPHDCPFLDGGGCYAEAGQLGKFVTQPLNEAAGPADPLWVALAEAEAIDAITPVAGRPLRLHTVGDCASDQAAAIVSNAAERYMARGGGPVWTYTHAWRAVARSSWGAVSVLASCENALEVEIARARGYAAAIVVEEFESDKLYMLGPAAPSRLSSASRRSEPAAARETSASGGVKVLPCPQQTRGVACTDCRLCMNDQGVLARGYAIGFELHGTPVAIKAGRKALRDPEDPDRRLTSRELIPRVLAREPGLSNAEIAARLGLHESSVWEMRNTLAGRPRRRPKVAA